MIGFQNRKSFISDKDFAKRFKSVEIEQGITRRYLVMIESNFKSEQQCEISWLAGVFRNSTSMFRWVYYIIW